MKVVILITMSILFLYAEKITPIKNTLTCTNQIMTDNEITCIEFPHTINSRYSYLSPPECMREAYSSMYKQGGFNGLFPPLIGSLPEFHRNYRCKGDMRKIKYQWEIDNNVALSENLNKKDLTKKELKIHLSPCEIFTWKFTATNEDGKQYIEYGKEDNRRNCKSPLNLLGLESVVGKVYLPQLTNSSKNRNLIYINIDGITIYKRLEDNETTKCTKVESFLGYNAIEFLRDLKVVAPHYIKVLESSGQQQLYRTNSNNQFKKICREIIP